MSISWKEYFSKFAILTSQRSKDPVTKVGAVIVNKENRILGTGYNGFPNGIKDDELPWGKESKKYEETKYAYVVHAEANCLINALQADLRGCTIYITQFPCNECTKLIIQKGIKKIIYLKELKEEKKDDGKIKASKKMLKLANIKYEFFNVF